MSDRPLYLHEEADAPPLSPEEEEIVGGLDAPVEGAHLNLWRAYVGRVRAADHLVVTCTPAGELVLTTNLPSPRVAEVLARAASILRGDLAS